MFFFSNMPKEDVSKRKELKLNPKGMYRGRIQKETPSLYKKIKKKIAEENLTSPKATV